MQPGGEVAWHSHEDRPALIYVTEGSTNGGRFLVKLFMSPEHPQVLSRLRRQFRDVRTTKPESSRKGSSEIYAVGAGFTGACG